MRAAAFFGRQFFREKYAAVIVLVCLSFLSCRNTTQEQTATQKNHHQKYSLYTMDQEGSEYLLEISLLDTGTIVVEEQANKLSPRIHRDLIVRDGYYYHKNKDQLTRYQIKDKELHTVSSVALDNFYIDNYCWISPDSLLLLGFDKECALVKLAKIYIPQMSAAIDTLDIQLLSEEYNYTSIGFSDIRDGRLLVGYSYHREIENEYQPCDTLYVGVFSYPRLEKINVIKDARSTYPGGDNFIEPASFTDEAGDFYFLSCPGVAMGNHPQKPTALYRIKAGQTILDTSYFFNVSSSIIANDAYSIYYLGNKKAIIRSEQENLFTGWNDHWKVPHFQFYLFDLVSAQLTKLPLPLDKGTRRQCVLVEGGTAYISINSAEEGNCIWKYDLATGDLSKGLKLEGATNYILRIDPLYSLSR